MVFIVILAIFLHRGNGRATGFNKMVRRTQDGGVPFTLGAAAWRQKRSPDDELSCYTGRVVSFTLPSNNKVSVPICKTIQNCMCQFDGRQQQPEEMCSVPYDHDGRSLVTGIPVVAQS